MSKDVTLGIVVYFLNKESFKMVFYTILSVNLIHPTEYIDVLLFYFIVKILGQIY